LSHCSIGYIVNTNSIKKRGEIRLTERSVVGVDRLGAVVLVVVVAPLTVQTRQDLSANTDSLADLEFGNLVTNVGDGTDNLVSWDDPVGAQGTPTASNGVDVGAANTTVGDGDGDIVRALGLELVLVDSEVGVVLGVYLSAFVFSSFYFEQREHRRTGDTVTFSVSGRGRHDGYSRLECIESVWKELK
jgi:hypothetical protein